MVDKIVTYETTNVKYKKDLFGFLVHRSFSHRSARRNTGHICAVNTRRDRSSATNIETSIIQPCSNSNPIYLFKPAK